MTNPIKFLSLNVKGLNSPNKRRQVWRYLLHHDPDVFFIQETHLLPIDTRTMSHPRYPTQYWACSSSKTNGVAIFFKPGWRVVTPKITADDGGRFLKTHIVWGRWSLTFNIYAPNQNQDVYLRLHLRELLQTVTTPIVLGGILIWSGTQSGIALRKRITPPARCQ